MKRFILFAGDGYYPEGLEDFVESFDDLETAEKIGVFLIDKRRTRNGGGSCDWYEILDTKMKVLDSDRREKLKQSGLLT